MSSVTPHDRPWSQEFVGALQALPVLSFRSSLISSPVLKFGGTQDAAVPWQHGVAQCDAAKHSTGCFVCKLIGISVSTSLSSLVLFFKLQCRGTKYLLSVAVAFKFVCMCDAWLIHLCCFGNSPGP